jgi:hypothetical protein
MDRSTRRISVHAFKPGEHNGALVRCNETDEEATLFRVIYPGMGSISNAIEVRNRADIDQLKKVINAVFKAGMNQAFLKVRQLIGAK